MLDTLFSNHNAATGSLTLGSFAAAMAVALVLGAMFALVFLYRNAASRSFALTLALLPAVVAVVIMMVSGSLGAGVAVAGTFSLVRFRSQPGTAREICGLFMAMAVGLACGMGYLGFAALFALVMCAVTVLYTVLGFGTRKGLALTRQLRITVPEDLDYSGAFDDVLEEFTSDAKLVAVKTSNLGSLYKLTYEIRLKQAGTEKQMIDRLRCRNGNLEIASSVLPTDGKEL